MFVLEERLGLEEKLVFEREISASEKMKKKMRKQERKYKRKVQERSTRERKQKEENKRKKNSLEEYQDRAHCAALLGTSHNHQTGQTVIWAAS